MRHETSLSMPVYRRRARRYVNRVGMVETPDPSNSDSFGYLGVGLAIVTPFAQALFPVIPLFISIPGFMLGLGLMAYSQKHRAVHFHRQWRHRLVPASCVVALLIGWPAFIVIEIIPLLNGTTIGHRKLDYSLKLVDPSFPGGAAATQPLASPASEGSRTRETPSAAEAAATAARNSDIMAFTSEDKQSDTSSKPVEKVPSGKPLSYFLEILRTNNGIQSSNILRPYKNTLVSYTGKVVTITPNPKTIYVGIATQQGVPIFCQYPISYNDLLARLDSGSTISGVGTIDGISSQTLVLDDCHP